MIAPIEHRVGKFDFSIKQSNQPPDRDQCTRALTNWLLSEWHKQQEEQREQTTSDR